MVGLLSADCLTFPLERAVDQFDVRALVRDARVAAGIAGFGRLVAWATGVGRAEAERSCREAEELAGALRTRWADRHGLRLDPFLWASAEALYVTVRCLRPERTVETGVERGISSAFLLSAMERNGHGSLLSIDLPTFDPAGRTNRDGLPDRSHVAGPEWVGGLVDASLRSRWALRVGDARTLLPQALDELGTIDAFFHDSEHSYEHMLFEYHQVWDHLRPGGCLISDDVAWSGPSRRAWTEFVAGRPGRACVYFSSVGNRGMIVRR